MSATVLHLSMARISQNATPQPEPSHSTLRLTRRGRVVFTTLAAVPLVVAAVVLAMSGGMALAADGSTGDAVVADYVTLAPGQSLWNVAQAIAPVDDPRDVIADVVSLNCLTGDAVQPGQRLALPAGYSY